MRRLAVLLVIVAPAWAADLPARLDWSQPVQLASAVSGVVETVNVRPGQSVRAGEVLASLNQTLFKAALLEARADIDRLTQEEADASRELARVNELYARTVAATTELDAARLRHARALSLLVAAQARVERARRQLDETEVRAPFEARVLERRAEPGLVVAAQCQPTALLTVARADEIVARAPITAERAARLRPGTSLAVMAGGQTHAGQVAAVRAQADGRYLLDVLFPRPEGLVAGMAATIRLP